MNKTTFVINGDYVEIWYAGEIVGRIRGMGCAGIIMVSESQMRTIGGPDGQVRTRIYPGYSAHGIPRTQPVISTTKSTPPPRS